MADGRKINVVVDLVTGKTAEPKKAVGELEREVIASQKRIEANAKRTQKIVTDAEKTRVKEAINQEKILERSRKQIASNFISTVNETAKKSQSIFQSAFGGAFFGTLGGFAVSKLASAFSALPSVIGEAFKKAMDFSQMKTSLAQFEGSAAAAEARIQSLMKVAAETPGLSFFSAVEGQKRLEAIGFAATDATKILTGMARVRVLSGSTKEDLDAMLVNFVQIASGGQKVTQEIREMATRMPAIVKIIRDEFGTIGKKLNEIDPKEFIRRLADAASKVRADFASSALAVENFQDSIDRLYVAIGSIIEQNPDVIAAFEYWTKTVDENATALADHDSQQRATFGNFISWLARASISVGNFFNFTAAVATDFQNIWNRVVTSVVSEFIFGFRGINAALNENLIKPLNKTIDWLRSLGAVVGGTTGALITAIPKFQDDGTTMADVEAQMDAYYKRRQAIFKPEQGWFQNSRRAEIQNADNWTEFQFLQNEARTRQSRQYRFGEAGMTETDKVERDTDAKGKKGRSAAEEGGIKEYVSNLIKAEFGQAVRGLSPKLKFVIERQASASGIPQDLAFAQIFSESRFNPRADSGQARGLTQFTPGTAKRFGYNINELVRDPEKALSAWGKYMSWLFDRYGDWELATLAYHQGEGTVDKFVALLKRGEGKGAARAIGKKGKAYLGQISALAGLRGDSQFERAKPVDLDTGITTEGDVFGVDALSLRSTKQYDDALEALDRYKGVLDSLFQTQFDLNEQTELSNLNRKIELGLLPGLTEEQLNYARAIAAETDAKIQKKKDDEEALQALEKYHDEQQRLFEDTARGWEDLLTNLATGNFKGIWDQMRRDMLQMFIQPASQYLARLFTGQGVTVGGGQPGLLGGLLGGGGGMGPGGTPMFNGGMQFAGAGGYGGSSGGGLLGNLFGMFGGGSRSGGSAVSYQGPGIQNTIGLPGGGTFTAGGKGLLGKLGGLGGIASMGGMAATMVGGALGGKWGNFLSMTGMGVSIGAQFGGPWGALIGGLIGAGAGGIMALFGGDDAIKKLKQAAASEFGINVKDKSILKQLKQIGEGYFGKGAVGKNAVATVRTEEGMNILRAYADATGQSGLKIDRLNFGDPNWKGNQFRSQFGGFREFGGDVRRGMSYIVGEKRPEVFVPHVNGTIMPSAANMTATAGSGELIAVISRQNVIIGQMEETLHQFANRLEGISAGQVVRMGANDAQDAIYEATQSIYEAGGRATERDYRNKGSYR